LSQQKYPTNVLKLVFQAAQESQLTIRYLFYFQYRVFSESASENLLDFNELKHFNSIALFFGLITFP